MALIGYARVSTDEQDTAAQQDALRGQGCEVIFEDKASGVSKDRPKLACALERVGSGDTLLVVRIDRLARSLAPLLEIVEPLRAKGAFFRSINDPIDTSSPQGMLMTQMLGAFAEFERALVLRQLHAISPPVRSFSERTLVKACRNLVRAGYADLAILGAAPRLPLDTRVARLVADCLNTHPDSTLRENASWLSRDLREPTPRGGLSWSAEGVRRVVELACKLNLLERGQGTGVEQP